MSITQLYFISDGELGLGGFAYVIDEDPFVAPVELALDDTKPDGSYPAIIGSVH